MNINLNTIMYIIMLFLIIPYILTWINDRPHYTYNVIFYTNTDKILWKTTTDMTEKDLHKMLMKEYQKQKCISIKINNIHTVIVNLEKIEIIKENNSLEK
jgi:hypothetical protein